MPLKFLSNFRRTLQKPIINSEVTLMLTWSKNCVISSTVGKTEFKTTDVKLYVSAVTLSTQDNVKLLKQLEFGFKRTINWNKYQLALKALP